MKFIKTYNESLRDQMIPKSNEDVIKAYENILSEIDYDPNAEFKPTKKVPSGTWLLDEFETTYDILVEMFGEPEIVDWDGTFYFWTLKTTNDRLLGIYDRHSNYSQEELKIKPYKWHISGTEIQDKDNLIAKIILYTIEKLKTEKV
jgi:hypothetical protein